MGWFWDTALPFSSTARGLGIYAYTSDNRTLAISLFACAVYPAKGCAARWAGIYFKRAGNCVPGRRFDIDAGQYGMFVTSTDEKSETWADFRSYCEISNLFLIFYSRREFYPVPKRAFGPGADLESFLDPEFYDETYSITHRNRY
jgi:YcxB-like protein